jgi:hypothetical protein
MDQSFRTLRNFFEKRVEIRWKLDKLTGGEDIFGVEADILFPLFSRFDLNGFKKNKRV